MPTQYLNRSRPGYMWKCPTCGQLSRYVKAEYGPKRSLTKWTFSFCDHDASGQSGIEQVFCELPDLYPPQEYSDSIQAFLEFDI